MLGTRWFGVAWLVGLGLVGACSEGTSHEVVGKAQSAAVADSVIWSGAGQKLDGSGPCSAISGDTALLVGYRAASISVRSGSQWNLQQTLSAPAATDGDFGQVGALSGDTALILGGGNNASLGIDPVGRAYVFTRSGGVWSLQQALNPSDSMDDSFGRSLALSGDTALLGSAAHGEAYVFVRSGSVWSPQQKLAPGNLGSKEVFGDAVALDGDTALIGHKLDSGQRVVHVFTRSGSTWSEQQQLSAPSGAFGAPLALSGDSALIAASRAAGGAPDSGVAYVFARSGSSWSLQQLLAVNGAALGGSAVALSGDNALVTVGASVYLFTRSGDTWSGQRQFADGTAEGIVAVSEDTTIIAWSRLKDDAFGYSTREYFTEAYSRYVDKHGCAVDADCVSGHCVEDVCCDTTCGDGCTSCLGSGKSFGVDGMCGFVAAGTDPRAACPYDISTCNTGVCDGRGACGLYPDETVCTPRYCEGDHEAYGRCGGGRCYYAKGFDCSIGYGCNQETGSCNSSCKTADDCDRAGGFTCIARQCRLPVGAVCVNNRGQCGSGSCVNGVCCESECPGACSACSNALTGEPDGKCAPIKAGVTCAPARCEAGMSTEAATCDGVSVECPEPSPVSCGDAGCDGAACAASRPNGEGQAGQGGQPAEPASGEAGRADEPDAEASEGGNDSGIDTPSGNLPHGNDDGRTGPDADCSCRAAGGRPAMLHLAWVTGLAAIGMRRRGVMTRGRGNRK